MTSASDVRRYTVLLDTSIILGSIGIALHLIVGLPSAVLLTLVVVICVLSGIGMYFKLRKGTGEPGSAHP